MKQEMNDNEVYIECLYNEIVEDLEHIDCEEVKRWGTIKDLVDVFEELKEVAEKVEKLEQEYHSDKASGLIVEKIDEIEDNIRGANRLMRVFEELVDEFGEDYSY